MTQGNAEPGGQHEASRPEGWAQAIRVGGILVALALVVLWMMSGSSRWSPAESRDQPPPSPPLQASRVGDLEPSSAPSLALPPQDYRSATPVPLEQARMIQGYCEAMYAMRDDGMVDVRELARLDMAAMGAKDAGQYDKELEFNKQAYKLARRLLKDSFAQYLSQGLKEATPDFRTGLEKLDGEFQASLEAEDLVSAAAQYRRLLQLLESS